LAEHRKEIQGYEDLAAEIGAEPGTLALAWLLTRLTWDQGRRWASGNRSAWTPDIDIFFCDPHAPWQRATNENTNGLLRQYFPKSSDLSAHSADDLDWVAAELTIDHANA
jgi:IS30 family transposase